MLRLAVRATSSREGKAAQIPAALSKTSNSLVATISASLRNCSFSLASNKATQAAANLALAFAIYSKAARCLFLILEYLVFINTNK